MERMTVEEQTLSAVRKLERTISDIAKPSGLVVGLPTRGKPVAFEWALCLAMQNFPMNMNRYFTAVKGNPVDIARNKIVKFALKENAKYIWFLDDDVAAPFFAARRLIYDLEMADDDVMIAGGIYGSKTFPCEPCVFNGNGGGPFWKWKKGEVFPCTGIGTGCMVIRTELFKLLPHPEHEVYVNYKGEQEDIPMWFKTVDLGPSDESLGAWQTDDLYFCNKVIEAGYGIVADGGVLCIHWDTTSDPPRPYQLPEDSYPMKDMIAESMIAT